MTDKCPDCEKAKEDHSWPIYRNGCRQCAKRQLNTMPAKNGLTAPDTWVGIKQRSRKEKISPPLMVGTLEKRILIALLNAWDKNSMCRQDQWKFDLQDFERVDVEAASLVQTDHAAYIALIMQYRGKARQMQDQGHEYQTQSYYEKLERAHSWMLEYLKDVIQKHMWKSVGGCN